MTTYDDAGGAVWRLMAAQAMAGANSTVIFATGAVIGEVLAPAAALATLPISLFVVGMAVSTLPAGMLAERNGRRSVFRLGTVVGMAAGVVGALAMYAQSFALFCVATCLGGAYGSVVLTFRFAAADCVPEARRPRALASVLAGGVVAGVLGGALVSSTMDLLPKHRFAGTYLASAVAALLSAFILWKIEFPAVCAVGTQRGRPLGEIARQPRFVAAVMSGIVTYLLMNFLMTAAPLAMKLHGHHQEHANHVVGWHVVAMYAPSFITGRLITRFGPGPITSLGLVITALAAAIGLTGTTASHFLLALIALGVGWNLGFAGASAMVLETHRPEERARVQAINDFLVFGSVAIGSFISGGVLLRYGWEIVCWLALPPIALALPALFFFGKRSKAALLEAR